MTFMLCRVRVADYAAWKAVFDSHVAAHRQAGLKVNQLLRNIDEPNEVFILMEADDLEKARAFVTSPDVPDAKQKAGVIGEPDVYFLE